MERFDRSTDARDVRRGRGGGAVVRDGGNRGPRLAPAATPTPPPFGRQRQRIAAARGSRGGGGGGGGGGVRRRRRLRAFPRCAHGHRHGDRLLFLGGGTRTFATDNGSVAALLIATYPRFPQNMGDQRCHLQAFGTSTPWRPGPGCCRRWTPRRRGRCTPRWSSRSKSSRSGRDYRPVKRPNRAGRTRTRTFRPRVRIRIKIRRNPGAEPTDETETFHATAPCLLPEEDRLVRLRVVGDRYWPVEVNLATTGPHRAAAIDLLYARRRLPVQRLTGALPYAADPTGARAGLARALHAAAAASLRPPRVFDAADNDDDDATGVAVRASTYGSSALEQDAVGVFTSDPALLGFKRLMCGRIGADDAASAELAEFCRAALHECMTREDAASLPAYVDLHASVASLISVAAAGESVSHRTVTVPGAGHVGFGARRWAPPPPPSGTRSPRATFACSRRTRPGRRDRVPGSASGASRSRRDDVPVTRRGFSRRGGQGSRGYRVRVPRGLAPKVPPRRGRPVRWVVRVLPPVSRDAVARGGSRGSGHRGRRRGAGGARFGPRRGGAGAGGRSAGDAAPGDTANREVRALIRVQGTSRNTRGDPLKVMIKRRSRSVIVHRCVTAPAHRRASGPSWGLYEARFTLARRVSFRRRVTRGSSVASRGRRERSSRRPVPVDALVAPFPSTS